MDLGPATRSPGALVSGLDDDLLEAESPGVGTSVGDLVDHRLPGLTGRDLARAGGRSRG